MEIINSELGSSFDLVVFCTNNRRIASGAHPGRVFVCIPLAESHQSLTVCDVDIETWQHEPEVFQSLDVQHILAKKWSGLDPKCRVDVTSTVDEALELVRSLGMSLADGGQVQAFLTGSLHLVGAALSALEGDVVV